MRVLRFVSIGLVLAGLALAAGTYGTLPEQVPTKLDLSGTPVRYAARSVTTWFALPVMNLVLLAILALVSARLPDKPHWFNFPDKERFLALPRRYQAPVIEEMRLMLEVTALGVVLTLLAVQVLLWRTAMGERSGLLSLAPFIGVLLTPVLLTFVLRVQTATEREEKRWRADAAAHGDEGSRLPHEERLAPRKEGS